MMYRYLKEHRHTILIGAPVAMLLASSLSLMRHPGEVCIVPTDSRYVAIGEEVTLDLTVLSDEPVNVIAATLEYPRDLVAVDRVGKEESVIDLWTEEPVVEDGTIRFAGGVIAPGGFVGTGTVLTLQVRPLAEGDAVIGFREVHLFAHDGTGMEVTCGKNPITLSVRPPEHPTPDVNGDSRVNIFDFGLVSARLFWGYEVRYDLNMDGRITIADLAILLGNLTRGEQVSSLVLFWRE